MSRDSDFERLLRQARETLPQPEEAATRRARERALAAIHGGRRFRLRSTVALVAALLAATGLGVGVGAMVTPSGTAAPAPAGLGFLPQRGWSVLQNGGNGTAVRPAVAIAANIPLSPDDDADGLPYSTLQALPPNGVVLVASFTARGLDQYHDALFPARELPLRLSKAALEFQFGAQVRPTRPLGQYQMRAAVKGHNVDVNVYFGTERPSAGQFAAAQRQLDRLVVASERVTIFARPTVVSSRQGPGTLFGSVDNGKAGEVVTIQVKECGQHAFRGVASATSHAGGGWSTTYGAGINATFRAVWNGATSSQITVRQRATVVIDQLSPSRFEVGVGARAQFWRKRLLFQRFDRRLGTWATVRSVVMTETFGSGGGIWSRGKVTASLPKGTLVRAVLPLSEARPCYLAGYSNMLRT